MSPFLIGLVSLAVRLFGTGTISGFQIPTRFFNVKWLDNDPESWSLISSFAIFFGFHSDFTFTTFNPFAIFQLYINFWAEIKRKLREDKLTSQPLNKFYVIYVVSSNLLLLTIQSTLHLQIFFLSINILHIYFPKIFPLFNKPPSFSLFVWPAFFLIKLLTFQQFHLLSVQFFSLVVKSKD